MRSRCPVPGQPLDPRDQAEIDRFAAFLRDPDPDRAAAHARHYPEEHPVTTDDGGASVCLTGDDWHDTYIDTGSVCCPRCQEHHRYPIEQCPGITPDGDPAEFPTHQEPLP